MSGQIQCPNCSGYKIFVKDRSFEDPTTHKSLHDGYDCFSVVGCSTFLIGAIIGGIILALVSSNLNVAIYGGIFLGAIIFFVAVAVRRSSFSKTAITVYHCYCQICGKEFDEKSYPASMRISS